MIGPVIRFAPHDPDQARSLGGGGSGGGGGSDLAVALEPALIRACAEGGAEGGGGELSSIGWFRSDWQSSGAATGYATFTPAHTLPGGPRGGEPVEVVVKLPVGPAELAWTVRLSDLEYGGAAGEANGAAPGADERSATGLPPTGPGPALNDPRRHDPNHLPYRRSPHLHHPPTPRVLAYGLDLGGHDLGWLVVERLSGRTLAREFARDGLPGETAIHDLLDAAARWYAAAERARPLEDAKAPAGEDHAALLHAAREAVRHKDLAEPQRWGEAIKHVQKILPRLTAVWSARPVNAWCHGDLHTGNAMRRPVTPAEPDPAEPAGGAAAEAAPCVLIDLALVHPGHWVEDAVYLERLHWARPDLLHGVKPVPALARHRKAVGLLPGAGDDHALYANIRRLLMAATAPAFLQREGHPKYIHAALEMVERMLPLV